MLIRLAIIFYQETFQVLVANSIHYRKSPLSRSIPYFEESLRAINLTKFSELYEEKVLSGAGYQYAVITDVTNYFPTLYTHTIPWGFHGKVAAKKNRRSDAGGMYGNVSIDDHDGSGWANCRSSNWSRHFPYSCRNHWHRGGSELREELGAFPAGFRYVDDFFLFLDTRDEAERGLQQ